MLLKNQQREVGGTVSSPFRWSLTVLIPMKTALWMLAPDWIEKNPLYYSAQLVNSKFTSHWGARINRVAWNWHSNTLFPGAPLFLSIFLSFLTFCTNIHFTEITHPVAWMQAEALCHTSTFTAPSLVPMLSMVLIWILTLDRVDHLISLAMWIR